MAQKDSTGTYTCVARNKLGMAKNDVHLEIKGEAEVANIFYVLCDFEQILQVFKKFILLKYS